MKINNTEIYNRWNLLCGKLWASDRDSAFGILDELYTEQHRYYHNWNHILHCLQLFEKFVPAKSLRRDHLLELELAIWFHDSVYDPIKSDNESESAKLFMDVCNNTLKPDVQLNPLRVVDLIEGTKDHYAVNKSLMHEWLYDIDLSILGENRDLFLQYEDDIRKEYDWVPYDIFCSGRIKILKEFLNRPFIFHFVTFEQNGYEDRAKENLKLAIEVLSDGI